MKHPAAQDDTIAAVATPPGLGALGVIRVSGPQAIPLVNGLFPRKDLTKVKGYTLHFGPLVEGEEVLDEVLLSVFRGPHSYTGQDSVELSCHGSPYILQRVMEALLRTGIRPAEAGEFTLRAFLNGKLDLSQAEAVADLIASENESARRAALEQMRGGFSARIRQMRDQLLQFASLLELELDFSEEDVEFANRETLNHLLDNIYEEVDRLATSFQLGNVVKVGVKVVIAGRPNAGKSTLLNALLNEERAIVSDIPGTTRDTIEDVMTLDGIQFRFIDTAGLRDTTDTLENIGIARTLEKIKEAHLVLYLFDVNHMTLEELQDDLAQLDTDRPVLVVGNKTDRSPEADHLSLFPGVEHTYFISGKEGHNLETLKKGLVAALDLPDRRLDDPLITNLRHYNVLRRIRESADSIRRGLRDGLTSDFLAIDIRRALHDMGEITGEITTDEILGNIFGKFCIGK